MAWGIQVGDCVAWLEGLDEGSVDAIVTDPPYGLGFMGKAWDVSVPGVRWAEACRRVLKPGGHLIAFGGTRTVHRLAAALEDGGLELRDTVHWCYWQGFPKSMDVSKAIDKAAGADRPAAAWHGWGTALKPAVEPAILARKPLTGTVAANVLEYGTGGLNIDATRFPPGATEWAGPDDGRVPTPGQAIGRWPANLIYVAKASRRERERGCEGLAKVTREDVTGRKAGSAGQKHGRSGMTRKGPTGNPHPTVKPVRLMRWLVRLVTPPGGLVVDPFAGSGTTGVAALLEGLSFAGAEISPEYALIAGCRIASAIERPDEWAATEPFREARAATEAADAS